VRSSGFLSEVSGGAAGQFTISGSGFGAVQGTGAVWLGSTYATATSWSDTQIVAKVASNSTSGTARVQQRGVWSNSVPITVNTATISTVTPDIGLPGTPVTIAGSGFGGNPGQVWLGTAAGVVQSWSDSQIQATVGAGSTSGNAQVLPLQSGVMSNAVPFTVNLPQIESISPTSGTSGTLVTFTGSGFGSSPGTVWLGSTAGQYQQWSDTLVTAVVAPTALSGIAKIQPSGGAWSNAVGFTVPTSGGTSMILTPSMLNMVVGDTRTLQALSSTGQSMTGLAWTSSDKTVVSLSTDDPPVLTAVSAGHVTITAGTGSADVTVSAVALAVGTVIWSNPGNGSGVDRIVPAVPSANGVADVFAFQDDGTVQAITSDGATAWTADVSQAWRTIPDFQGGLVAIGQNSIWKLDGITGQAYPAYTPSPSYTLSGTSWFDRVAVHTDGTIFAVQAGKNGGGPSAVVGIDPITGTQKFSVPIVDSGGGPLLESQRWGDVSQPNGPIIAGDGYAYFAYIYRSSDCVLETLEVLRISSSGAYDNIKILELPANTCEWDWLNASIITNADTGVLLTWRGTSDDGQTWASGVVTVTGTSASLISVPQMPGQYSLVRPVLQAQDGSFVGTVDTESGSNMIAFDASGNVRWMVPNEQPQIATDDGGVIGQSGITYDSNGNATGQMGNLPTQSWTGNTYQVGSVDQILTNFVNLAISYWPFAGGNASGNGSAARPVSQDVRQLIAQIATSYANPPQNATWENKPGKVDPVVKTIFRPQ
jgi:hypothetical protein